MSTGRRIRRAFAGIVGAAALVGVLGAAPPLTAPEAAADPGQGRLQFDTGSTVSQRKLIDKIDISGTRLKATRAPVKGSKVQEYMKDRFDTKEECLAAVGKPDPDDPDKVIIQSGRTVHPNRYSSCRVIEVTASLINTPVAYGKMWVVLVNNTDPFTRTMTSKLWIHNADVYLTDPLADPEGKLRRAVRDTDMRIGLECFGIESSTCDNAPAGTPSVAKNFEGGPQDFGTWELKDQAKDPMTLTFVTDKSPASKTTPFLLKSFPEAGQQQDIDAVSYHQLGLTVDGDTADPVKADDVFRCDNARYVRARHGCVWKILNWDKDPGKGRLTTAAIHVVPYNMAPRWADHVLKAQNKPLETQPYAPDPNLPGAPRDPFGWGGAFNIGGALTGPSSQLPLNRIYAGAHNERTTQGRHAATQVESNRNMVGRACNRINQRPSGITQPECDEYPFASTWEGAQYTQDADTKSKPWKFSVRMLPHRDNNDHGRDLKLFYSWGHVLHGGDPFHVLITDIPRTRAGRQASKAAYDARADAQPRSGAMRQQRAYAGDDLCTMPDVPGIEYVCDFDAEVVKYDSGMFEMFVVGKDGQAYHNWTSAGKWAGWKPFGGWHDGPIEVVSRSGGSVTLRTTGTDGNPYYKDRDGATGKWNEWHQ